MKTPKFWLKRNLISLVLLPLSLLYFFGFYLKEFFTKRTKVEKPVICIGNLIAGGSGKTPVAIAIGKILHEMGFNFSYLTRGYKRKDKQDLLLAKNGFFNSQVSGDEPILLAEISDCFVTSNKLQTLKKIVKNPNYDLVIFDDGIQNSSIFYDLKILVVDGNIGFGNKFLLPAGPMRESLKFGLKKADLIIVIGDAKNQILQDIGDKKIVKANIIASNLNEFVGKKLIAFCGLAYPQKFFSFILQKKLNLIKSVPFADHHFYTNQDLDKLLEISKKEGATLITTKKDWVKFSPKYREQISYLNIDIEFENKNLIIEELKKFIC